jgi:hypothetical protein
MTPQARVSRGNLPASAGRAIPAYVLFATVLTCGLSLPTGAHSAPVGAATSGGVFAAPGSVRIPKQPAASQPEAVPSATSPLPETPVPQAQFNEAWLLPLGAGLAGLAALSVLLVVRRRNDSDDD